MPWQNKEDGNSGRGKNPWGRAEGEGDGQRPRNPWGEGRSGGGDRSRGGGSSPDFDEFIRRSQEKLRGLGGGGGSTGGGGGGQRPALPNLPWGLIAGGVLVVGLALTAFYRVDAGQRAVVTRFGQFHVTNGPGLHFKLPAPIDNVTKVQFEDIRTEPIGTAEGDNQNLMLTGDGNVINIAYAVRWRLRNAEDFLFQLADPAITVRNATESAMREVIGRSTLDNAIGPERAAIAEQVRERVQEILDGYASGVLVQGVDINRADPPAAVDEAFKDVSAAQQDAQQFLNQARAYAQQISAQAAGATASFDKVYQEYRLAPEVTRKRLYLETMEEVMGKVDKTIIEAPDVQAYLPLPELKRRQQANRGVDEEAGR